MNKNRGNTHNMPLTMRRRFLLQSAALSAMPLTATWPLGSWAADGDLTAGIQLWSVRREIEKDPAATLVQIARFGYKKIETAGFGGLSAKEFRKIAEDNGLKITGAHQSYSSDPLAKIFDDANALGVTLTGSGMLTNGTGPHPLPEGVEGRGAYDWMLAMTADDAKRTAELANDIGAKAKQEGLKYYYHNHPFEFYGVGNGRTSYDILISETDPDLVDFQLDCGWAAIAEQDVVAILKQYGNRFSSIHVKNFKPLAAGMHSNYQRTSTELSNGVIDYAPILKTAKDIGIQHVYVEQEDPFDNLQPLAAAEANVNYLEELKKKHQM